MQFKVLWLCSFCLQSPAGASIPPHMTQEFCIVAQIHLALPSWASMGLSYQVNVQSQSHDVLLVLYVVIFYCDTPLKLSWYGREV